MICYKDRTFCRFEDCTEFETCYRALTIEHQTNANKLDLPICSFSDKPECFKISNKQIKEKD